ncbi:hypothetical protein [Nannocystis sp. SCPEA4]|uniref:hypothetical protein n=1 Tax=Nannocystis sp. SCPEA4 TaxID=2996787 RepID=UPI00226FF038|nr:hypothetical protein [Nannocystis sp. SCPEA4]MCY1060012.1 hypothetical protein [Nannocystis sp. SCPEA4]
MRYQSCPLGDLVGADVNVVRGWGRLDEAVTSGRFRALQRDRPRPWIRGDGSPLDRKLAADVTRALD